VTKSICLQLLLLEHALAQFLITALTWTVAGKCGTANSLAFAVTHCLERVHFEEVERAVQLVHRIRFLLEEVEWWCSHRQLCVHLELGTYRSKRSVCDVDLRLKHLVGIDGVVEGCGASSCSLDQTVFGLAMDEALSNARYFRSPREQIRIAVRFDQGQGSSMLHVEMDSVNRADVPLLSAEQCQRVVMSGYKKHSMSAFSDGVGLANVQQAANAVGGRIWLHGYTAEERSPAEAPVNHTVFHLRIPVDQIVWRQDVGANTRASSSSAENGINSLGMHAEALAQRRHDVRSESMAAPSALSNLDTPEVEAGGPSTAQTAQPAQPAQPAQRGAEDRLFCLGLDDSSMCRQLHEIVFSEYLDADMSRSVSLGASIEEVESFADVALGVKTADLMYVPEGERRAADVVLIDQHLLVDNEVWMGSDIASALRARGFEGLVCLMSGTDNEHLQELQAQTVIDVAFSKSDSPVYIADTIASLCKGGA